MRGKILILTGLAVGYVLGARAGRQRYEDIKSKAAQFWNDPRVQTKVEAVEDFAKDKAPEVADFISDNAKKVVSQVGGKKKSKAGSSSSSSSTSASKPSTSGGSTNAASS
ncbi:YtxH domain-containing protein [Salinibacterium sp. dk2585]|uniref:YtxH domain-containing protein n=1 Tax=unclassified Salinibacterium TaxID=2632331 RepID=UPI0011C249C4|nr:MULTISPECIES: YtxH domain-containing protein [unclassified Salinibacterium]QEE62435.1 YtxH domain-containing protein [Salinibacterium sp. dk2585]TXK52682.1 YtxH domain-containing protein [Salinibacterium sp. dk5596]